MTIKDSGKRRHFGTGSVRDITEGKGRYDLLPPDAIHIVAQVFQAGCKKYGNRNWEKGQPMSAYMDSALRHGFKWLAGKRDEDHLAAMAWNALCGLATRERIASGKLPKELDDLPI